MSIGAGVIPDVIPGPSVFSINIQIPNFQGRLFCLCS